MARQIELGFGLAAGVVGILGWLDALFGPVYASSTGASASVAQMSLNPTSAAFFAVMLVSILGVGVGAYLHHRGGRAAWLIVLWTSTICLVGGTIASGFSVGVFLLPGALLALGAAVAGLLVPSQASWL